MQHLIKPHYTTPHTTRQPHQTALHHQIALHLIKPHYSTPQYVAVNTHTHTHTHTGVQKAVDNVKQLAAAIKGMDPTDQEAIDAKVK
jgi:enolase